jgi:PAS domain S-box-containing protein
LTDEPELVASEETNAPTGNGPAGTGHNIAVELPWQREAFFQLLVESVSDYAIFGLDPAGRVTSWNAGAERINGYRSEEIIGKHFSLFYLPEEIRRGIPEGVLREAASKGRYEGEGWRVRKDGSRFWAHVVVTGLRDRAGHLQGFAKVTRDLTEQREREEAMQKAQAELEVRVAERTAELRRANESLQAQIAERRLAEEAQHELLQRFRLVLDFSPIGCVMNDVNFRVTYWNPAAERIFGFSRQDVLGKLPSDTFVPASSRAVVEQVRQAVARGETVSPAISEHVTKEGCTIICEWHNTPLRDSVGQFMGSLSMVQDITERQQAEEQLKAYSAQLRALAAELQSAREAERAHVARELHDELGQALTALKMDLVLLTQNLPRNRVKLHQRSASMLKLIDDTIQTVRRIAAGLRPSTLDDLGLTAAIEWQSQEFEARTGIRCRLVLPEEEIVLSPERSTALFRIFQETLTNVARHAGAKRVDVHLTTRGNDLVLEVSDDGKGLDEVEASSPGSLGLLGMRERARLLGGEFKIVGTPGKGTTVTVRMPGVQDKIDDSALPGPAGGGPTEGSSPGAKRDQDSHR